MKCYPNCGHDTFLEFFCFGFERTQCWFLINLYQVNQDYVVTAKIALPLM